MWTSSDSKKIYIIWKVLRKAIPKCNFYWFWATVSKGMGIYVKFTKTTHQIWSCHMTLVSNSENFYFFSNSVLNFKKVTKIGGNWLKNKKLQTGGGGGVKDPPVLIRLKILQLWIVLYYFILKVSPAVFTPMNIINIRYFFLINKKFCNYACWNVSILNQINF